MSEKPEPTIQELFSLADKVALLTGGCGCASIWRHLPVRMAGGGKLSDRIGVI